MSGWLRPEITLAGLDGLMLRYPGEIGEPLLDQIAATAAFLRASRHYSEVVPGYTTLYLRFDLWRADHERARAELAQKLDMLWQRPLPDTLTGRLHELPVRYDEKRGPDLPRVAEQSGLSVAEVIERHAAVSYRVYAVGFMPGFAYLGLADAAIATPRLASPRRDVPAGAVALADRQSAIYPANSPGGWNLIGHCETPLFNRQTLDGLLRYGDRVRFRPAGS